MASEAMSGVYQKASLGAPLEATEIPRGSHKAARGSSKSIPLGPKFGGYPRKGYTINQSELRPYRCHIARVIRLRSVEILMFWGCGR